MRRPLLLLAADCSQRFPLKSPHPPIGPAGAHCACPPQPPAAIAAAPSNASRTFTTQALLPLPFPACCCYAKRAHPIATTTTPPPRGPAAPHLPSAPGSPAHIGRNTKPPVRATPALPSHHFLSLMPSGRHATPLQASHATYRNKRRARCSLAAPAAVPGLRRRQGCGAAPGGRCWWPSAGAGSASNLSAAGSGPEEAGGSGGREEAGGNSQGRSVQ